MSQRHLVDSPVRENLWQAYRIYCIASLDVFIADLFVWVGLGLAHGALNMVGKYSATGRCFQFHSALQMSHFRSQFSMKRKLK